jgi:hypothetical protein
MSRLLLILGLAASMGAAGLSATQQPAQNPAGAPQSPDPRTALVMGQVVDADTGQAIAGAIVRFNMRAAGAPADAAGRGGQPGAVPTPLQLVELTDTDGRFLFHDLPKGSAAISASAPGYMVPNGPGGRGMTANRMLPVAEGEHIFDHKIRLVRFATISGTILDEAGEPAVGYLVQAVKRKAPGVATGPAFGESLGTMTDDRGRYRISQIAPGDYLVVTPQTQMTMPAQTGDDLISGLMKGGMGGLMGDLMSSGGAGMMGALGGVRVGNLMWSSGSSSSGSGFSGPAMGPQPGARLPGPPPPVSGRLYAYQTTYYPAALTPSMAAPITLRSGEDRDGVDFQLRPVVTSRVSGTVTGPNGPMKNVSVRLMAAGADMSDPTFDVATAMTANDGTFTMLGVPSGQYIAKVEKAATPDFRQMMADSPEMSAAIPPGLAAFMPQGSKESLTAEATIGVGDTDTTGVMLVMAPGAHIIGHVEFEVANKPTPQVVQSMTVQALPIGNGMSFGLMSNDKVSANGEFRTAGFPPGRYNLSVTPTVNQMTPSNPMSNWMVRSITVGGRDVTNEGIELKNTDLTDVVVTFTDQISNINGTVKAPASGGFEGVSVVYVPADYQRWLLSGGMSRRNPIVSPDAKGAFTIGRVPPGEYLIIAVDNGVLEATQSVDFYDRLARMAQRITVGIGEKKTVTLDITKVIK